MRMKIQTLCAALVLALLTGGAWAEQAQPSPSADLNAGGNRLEEKSQPLSDADVLQVSLSDSSNSTVCAESGWAWYKSKQYQDALRDFQEAISLDPTNATAYLGSGECHYELGEFEEAANVLSQYVILRSSSKGHYWLGASLLKLHRFNDAETEFRKAVDLFRKAIDQGSNKPEDYDGLGYSLLNLKRYEEAIPAYKKAVSLGGESAHRCASLGDCYYRINDFPQARDWYRKLVVLDPHNSDAYLSVWDEVCFN